jgi:D-3-phosphoglycerate dehydrogenase
MKILANDGLNSRAVDILTEAGHEVITTHVPQDQLIDYINQNQIETILVRSATKVRKDLIQVCPDLKFIGRAGVGVDNIDVEEAKLAGKIVFNTPAASSRSVAELVMGLIYSWNRSIHHSHYSIATYNFKELKKELESGREVKGQTLGIIGYGRIGAEVAKLAMANGMKTMAYDPYLTVGGLYSKEDVLKNADFVTIHVSGSDEILNASDFELMKPTAVVINASRGGCVNEEDLIEYIENKKLGGACLDTFMDEPNPWNHLLNHHFVLATPHIGGSTVEAQERIGIELADKLLSYVKDLA